LLTHYISTVFKRGADINFSGSKLVLQTSLGIQKTFDNKELNLDPKLKRDLRFKVGKDGRGYYEIVVPKGMIAKDIEDRIQKAIDEGKEPDDLFFYKSNKSKDLLGFRIPSSEMHSAVPMKIVGFYDSQGTNVVIAPDILVVLHGSDFDIDSLLPLRDHM
jgi:hypothetical protein